MGVRRLIKDWWFLKGMIASWLLWVGELDPEVRRRRNKMSSQLCLEYLSTSVPGLSRCCCGKESACSAEDARDVALIPGSGKIPWRRKWQPTAVFLTGKCYGQRSLVDCSPWITESDTTERTHTHTPVFSVQFICSVVSNSLRPHGLQHARLPCSSSTPRAYLNSCPWSRWCHPTISSSVVPFSSHLQSFPASGSFPMSQFFVSGGQSVGLSASAKSFQWIFRTLGWTG